MNSSPREEIGIARDLIGRGDTAAGLAKFDQLCRRFPESPGLLLDSANAFARCLDYDGVRRRFREIEALAKNPEPEVWEKMSRLSASLRRPEWALKYARGATGSGGTNPAGFALLAEHAEEANDADTARSHVEQALRLDPHCAQALLVRVRLHRRSKQWEAAHSLARQLIDDGSTPARVARSAGYELGAILDAVDDPTGAMAALEQAKQSWTPAEADRATVDWHRYRTSLHGLLTSVDETYFQNCARWTPEQAKPLVLLGGHPRSGTTLLEQVLDAHPAVCSVEEAEAFQQSIWRSYARGVVGNSSADVLLNVPIDRRQQMHDRYFAVTEAILNRPIGGRTLLDKNPTLTEAVPIFARMLPQTKYVIALRDPRDVVLSCYFQDLPMNAVSVSFRNLPDTALRYANTMAMWLVCRESMDPVRYAEVRYESLVTDLPAEAKRVTAFLGLDWHDVQARPDAHARTRAVVSPTYAAVTEPVHRRAIGRWRRYTRWLEPILSTLETFVRAFDYPVM